MTASRIMGDSTNYLAIPTSVQIAATYANGRYAVAEAEVEKRFPRARYGWCRIDVLGNDPAAHMRDWETGDKGGSLQQWCIDHNHATGKKDAVVYCDRSTVPEVRQLTGTQILGQDYFLCLSTLDGTVVTGPGIIGCQVKGAGLTGGDWDQSLVFDGSLWLPVTPPAPKPKLMTKAQATAALATLVAYVAEG